MLSEKTWSQVQQAFGEHSLDLFPLDFNAMIGIDGRPLQHFIPFWTPNTAGVNVFAQNISQQENCYAFPPFKLLVPLIGLINECQIVCTECFDFGIEGTKRCLRYPSKKVMFLIDMVFLGTCGLCDCLAKLRHKAQHLVNFCS